MKPCPLQLTLIPRLVLHLCGSGYLLYILAKAAKLDNNDETIKSKFYSLYNMILNYWSLQWKAMVSVLSGLFQNLEERRTSTLPSSSSIISAHCCLSRSSLHQTSKWIWGTEPLLIKLFNISIRLGQPISMQIDCTLFLWLKRDGELVMPWRERAARVVSL